MSHVVLAFAHNPDDWISSVMAFFTYGKWTHVAIVKGEHVIEATAVGKPAGVREVTLRYFIQAHPRYHLRAVPCADPDKVWAFCESQLGKKYDWLWVLSWPFRLRRGHPNRWSCSELICAAFQHAGEPLLAGDDGCHSVTPRDFYLISKEI